MFRRIVSSAGLAMALTWLVAGSVTLAAVMTSANYRLVRLSLAGSGGQMSSSQYEVSFTMGQPVIGSASSSNGGVDFGFDPGGSGGGGAIYLPLVVKGS